MFRYLFYFLQVILGPKCLRIYKLIINRASNVLSSKLSENEKIIRLKEIGEQSVDIDGVGLYTLGKYRKTLTDSQKEQ